jgi:hypothetical protein
MTPGRRTLLIAVIAFIAALGGVSAGLMLFQIPSHDVELHEVLHDQLNLDERQKGQLQGLEQRFAVRQRGLELELRAANARLADAIETEHGNGPKVAAAVDQSHQTMGELQKETLSHIFAMRQLLRPDQAAKFDRAVVHALTADER